MDIGRIPHRNVRVSRVDAHDSVAILSVNKAARSVRQDLRPAIQDTAM